MLLATSLKLVPHVGHAIRIGIASTLVFDYTKRHHFPWTIIASPKKHFIGKINWVLPESLLFEPFPVALVYRLALGVVVGMCQSVTQDFFLATCDAG